MDKSPENPASDPFHCPGCGRECQRPIPHAGWVPICASCGSFVTAPVPQTATAPSETPTERIVIRPIKGGRG